MTDRRCEHGKMPHEHCQRCDDYSNARQPLYDRIVRLEAENARLRKRTRSLKREDAPRKVRQTFSRGAARSQ